MLRWRCAAAFCTLDTVLLDGGDALRLRFDIFIVLFFFSM